MRARPANARAASASSFLGVLWQARNAPTTSRVPDSARLRVLDQLADATGQPPCRGRIGLQAQHPAVGGRFYLHRAIPLQQPGQPDGLVGCRHGAPFGFQQTSETLEEAAQNLGATPFKALIKITLPLITANLIAGGLLAFAFAMLEVSDSLILAQKQAFYPITKAILELFQMLGDGKFLASALGVWAMAFLALAIIGLGVFMGKKLGALFRV